MKEGEIPPPVRAGQSLPGPGGEVLRWAKRRCFFHDLELYFHRWSKDICFCSLFLRRQSEGVQKGLLPPFGRRAAPPRRGLIILLKSRDKIKSEGGQVDKI